MGAGPFSEPETRAIKDFVTSGKNFRVRMNNVKCMFINVSTEEEIYRRKNKKILVDSVDEIVLSFFFLLNLTFFLLGRKRVFFLFFVNLFFINSVWLCIWYITVGTNLYINEYI